MIKHCPLNTLIPAINTEYDVADTKVFDCCENKCAWWVDAYTTECRLHGPMCAIALIAMKNSDGKVPV